jgi:D-alanine-D-alanine ligase
MLNVGLVYNCPTEELFCDDPESVLNLTDPPEIIDAVATALEAGGHNVHRFHADHRLPLILAQTHIDIVFNIAPGIYGETRQANVPALLEHLQIPHTGSNVLAEAVTNHKPIMKPILMTCKLPTPLFQLFRSSDEDLSPSLRFPLIAKLPAEGGSLGIDTGSVVDNETDLRERIQLLLDRYGQGVLVEEYIDGREFTVCVLGNNPPYALPIVERLFFGESRVLFDEPEAAIVQALEHVTGKSYHYTSAQSVSVAPAAISGFAKARIQRIAIAAYKVLRCRDWARIDFRMNAQGEVFIIDVNLEPAIGPDYALAMSASAAGWTYERLVNQILNHAIERYPHLSRPKYIRKKARVGRRMAPLESHADVLLRRNS